MATKKDTAVMELDRTEEGQPPLAEIPVDTPKLILTMGRGRIGKSTFVRWAAERAMIMGSLPVIADADRTNATLSAFFENVTSPRHRPMTMCDSGLVMWSSARLRNGSLRSWIWRR